MKLFDTILLAITVTSLYIGVHQTIVIGFAESYWIFMFAISCLILYNYRREKLQKIKSEEKQKQNTKKPSSRAGK